MQYFSQAMIDYIISGIVEGLQQMTMLEAIAVIFGLLSVWYARKENILVYPTGIISVSIYVYICLGAKLYADMGINAYYFVVSIYGWIVWSKKRDQADPIPITRNSLPDNIISILIFTVSAGIIYYTLSTHTDSDVPLWDSLTTSVAFTAMWLMARKKLESWVAWIITDLLSIPLYFYKGYILTSFQFLVFLLIAILGYIAWQKNIGSHVNGLVQLVITKQLS